MPVKYNEQYLTPAPTVNIQKEYTKTQGGDKIGVVYSIQLRGTLLYFKGSPNSSQVFSASPTDETIDSDSRFTSIMKKQEAIRDLFADECKRLELTPWDSGDGAIFVTYPRVVSVEFPEGGWHTVSEYVVTLEADEIIGVGGAIEDDFEAYIREANESWGLEFINEPEGPSAGINAAYTFRLTHTVSAVGKKVCCSGGCDIPAWEQARIWTVPRLGLDTTYLHATSGLNLPSYYSGYDHARSESTDETAGSYSVVETWIISSGNYNEDFNISTRTSIEDALTTVSIDGTIKGLDTRNATFPSFSLTQNKWDAADARFAVLTSGGVLYNRAQVYSGITALNIQPVNTNIGRNPNTGVISYQYEYNNRPSNCISGATFESINITDVNPNDVFVRTPVIGRSQGPIFTHMGTITERKRTVAIDVVSPFATGCPCDGISILDYFAQSPASGVAQLLQCFEDNLTSIYDQVFVESDTNNWLPKTGKYSRTKTWIYQDC